MAAAGKTFQQEICDEATCSICQDYFKDPVIIPECGHNFCRTCLDQYWGKSGSKASCPQCRRAVRVRSLIQNRSLASVAEIVKTSALPGQKRAREEGGVCGKHQEPQKLFCQEDKAPICLVCDKSKEHRGHQVIPVEEALPEYKDQIVNCLETLKGKKEKMLVLLDDMNKESQEFLVSVEVNGKKQKKATWPRRTFLEKIETEREKAVMTFSKLHQFLEKKEKHLLAQMEEVKGEVERERENLNKLRKELQSLEGIIQEMEEKLQQPAVDLLQDIESFLERCKEETSSLDPSVCFPVALKWKIWDFCDINPFLEGVMEQFQDALENGLELRKANILLDPGTAQAELIVSEDCKSVRWTETPQDVPDNPERFDLWNFVLGREEFTAGRHFWEVTGESEKSWSVGVAKKNVMRKGNIDFLPAAGIWGMGRWEGKYQISGDDDDAALSLTEEPRKIRVSLNCEGGRVAFYDADRGNLICAYPKGFLPRETFHSFCYLYGNGHLTLCY